MDRANILPELPTYTVFGFFLFCSGLQVPVPGFVVVDGMCLCIVYLGRSSDCPGWPLTSHVD